MASDQEQIDELMELPIHPPQCPIGTSHVPFFVTNGRIHDVVLDHINTANLGWTQRNFPHALTTIESSQLVHRFLAVHGAYLPQEAHDFQSFLTLLLADGNAPLDKAAFSHLLEAVIEFADDMTHRNVSRSLSSAVLLTSYLLGFAELQANHWALFEGWTVTASYVLAAAAKFDFAENLWKPSFDLAMSGAHRALDDLAAECKTREQFSEGNPLVDGFFYGSRQLMLAGLLSAWSLAKRQAGKDVDPSTSAFIRDRIRVAFVWGESAAPFILLKALEMEQQSMQPFAAHLVSSYLQHLLACNEEGGRGLPDSFAGIEESIRFAYGIGEPDVKICRGISYTCQSVIDYLARRWWNHELASKWESITRLSLDSSIPQRTWEWFFWRSDSAMLESALAGRPQSWSALTRDAETRDKRTLPTLLLQQHAFRFFFPLVFPHRLAPVTFASIDLLI